MVTAQVVKVHWWLISNFEPRLSRYEQDGRA